MGLLRDFFLGWRAEPEPESRALQVTPWGNWGTLYQSSAGIDVNTDSSLALLTVYGASALIADTIATLPRDVFRNRADGSPENVNSPRWLEQPNSSTDIVEFVTQSMLSLLLDGNAYWAYSLDNSFVTTSLRCLDPSVITVRDDGNGPVYFLNGSQYRGRLLHVKGITRPGQLKGLSPVEAARQSIGVGLAAQEFAGNFYKNGTTVSGVIQTPGPLTVDGARRLKDNWSRAHGGVGNAHLPGVLDNGATWQQVSVTPEQAQFLESREYQAAEICAQMFLLDPSMLGIAINRGQNLTYANLEQRGIHLVQFTLMRWIIRLERAFTFLLPKPQYMKFNVNALMRADLLTRYQAYRIANPTAPFLEVDEIREKEDLPPMPEPIAAPTLVVPSTNGTTMPVGAN